MKMISIRDFRAKGVDVVKELNEAHDLVLTNNGKPFAIVSPCNESNLEENLKMMRRQRAAAALYRMQKRALELGLDKLSMDDINAEIELYREERRARQK